MAGVSDVLNPFNLGQVSDLHVIETSSSPETPENLYAAKKW